MKRIYLLGSLGMLGGMVRRYFATRPGFEIVPVEQRFDHYNLVDYFRRYDQEPPSVFVNCVGAIPQKFSREQDFVLPNILLPLELARGLAHHHQLIHPSTDCVFRGDRGLPYPSSAKPDANDAYGWSKIQAERALVLRPNTTVIRTSIIGPSRGPASGLLQWFLSQPQGARLSGFTNHLWNGITTQQWCFEVERLMAAPDPFTSRMVQYGWAGGCSKHEMLMLFREAFRPDITVSPLAHIEAFDRRLEPDVEVPDLRAQLARLKAVMVP